MQKRREQISGTIPELMTGGNGPVALDDDNVTQSDTAATNQLIAVVNCLGNKVFVNEMKEKAQGCSGLLSQTDQQRPFLGKGDWTLSNWTAIHTLPRDLIQMGKIVLSRTGSDSPVEILHGCDVVTDRLWNLFPICDPCRPNVHILNQSAEQRPKSERGNAAMHYAAIIPVREKL